MWKLLTLVALVVLSLTTVSFADTTSVFPVTDTNVRPTDANAFTGLNLTWLGPRTVINAQFRTAVRYEFNPYQPIESIGFKVVDASQAGATCSVLDADASNFKHSYNDSWVNQVGFNFSNFIEASTIFAVNFTPQGAGTQYQDFMGAFGAGTINLTKMDDPSNNFTGVVNDLFLSDLYANGTVTIMGDKLKCSSSSPVTSFSRKFSGSLNNSDAVKNALIISQKPAVRNNVSSRESLRYILYDYETNRTTFSDNDSLILNLDQLGNNEWIYDTRGNFFGIRDGLIMSNPINIPLAIVIPADELDCNSVPYTTTGVIGDLLPASAGFLGAGGTAGSGLCINLTDQHSSMQNQTVELPNDQTNGIFDMTGNIGLYHLNGTNTDATTFTDSSGFGNFGMCDIAGCPQPVQGLFGGTARQFDGINDQINITDSLSLNTTTTMFTLSAWFRTNDNTTQSTIFSQHSALRILAVTANAALSYQFTLSNGTLITLTSNNGVVQNDEFTHAAVTFNGTESKLFINGVEVDNDILDVPSMSQALNSPYSLGSCQGFFCVGAFWNGTLDETSIWNRSLSEEEVTDLFDFGTQRIVEVKRPFYGSMFFRGQECPNVLFGCNGGSGNDGFDIDFDLGFMGLNPVFRVDFVPPVQPNVPQANEKVTINFRSTIEAEGSIRYRFRSVFNDSEGAYGSFIILGTSPKGFSHNISIPTVFDDSFYQFELIATLDNGTFTVNNNSGNFFNFTVGGGAAFEDLNASLPNAIESTAQSLDISFTNALALFSLLIMIPIVYFTGKFGGISMAITAFATGICCFSLIGLLPFYVFLPFLAVAIFMMVKYLRNVFMNG